MQIEAGKFYKDVMGRRCEVMLDDGSIGNERFKVSHGESVEIWHFDNGRANIDCDKYDLIAEWTDEPASTPEVGTLRELNVQPGDVVEMTDSPGHMTVLHCPPRATQMYYDHWELDDGDGGGLFRDDQFRIISRATPALPHGHARLPSGAVADMTAITTPFGLLDAETQEALRAHGGPWEFYSGTLGWVLADVAGGWSRNVYRVKPQPPAPVVKTVTLLTGAVYDWCAEPKHHCGTQNSHRITFDLIDGKPDCASIRMVAL